MQCLYVMEAQILSWIFVSYTSLISLAIFFLSVTYFSRSSFLIVLISAMVVPPFRRNIQQYTSVLLNLKCKYIKFGYFYLATIPFLTFSAASFPQRASIRAKENSSETPAAAAVMNLPSIATLPSVFLQSDSSSSIAG